MNTKEEQKKVISLLKQNEIGMMELYAAFSRRYESKESFWLGIAGEEESHAAWVETLNYKTDTDLVSFAEKRFPIDAIKSNIQYMEKYKAKALSGELSLLQALEMSVHMERGMLENKFFEVFKNDDTELQIILEALRLGTQEHYHLVEGVWKEEKLGNEFETFKA